MPAKAAVRASRAVVRSIEAGLYVDCAHCGERIGFRAKDRSALQVVSNVYAGGVWKRVEHFHDECYDDAGRPHGDAQTRSR